MMIRFALKLPRRVYFKFLEFWWNFSIPLALRISGVEVGNNVRFYGRPIITRFPNSVIRIGDRVVLCSDSRFTALGVSHPVVIRTLREGAVIDIGADTGISGGSICAANNVSVGPSCLFGADVVVSDTDFHAIRPENRRYNGNIDDISHAAVVIGRNVFLGTRCVVLKGACVGENSIVGASSLVTRSITENSIAGGNPARVLKRLGDGSET